tara:strand:- start:470 stop:1288 length:819 start_codon:yes stop_codon:yes gene_type:complete
MNNLKIGIYANCQGTIGLKYYLTRLFPNCNIDCLMNYHYIKTKKKINYKNVKQYDIFIFQPLDEKHGIYSTSKNIKNSIINMLNKKCIKISFPYIYNDAFWPLTLREWDSKAVPNKESPHGIGIKGYHNSEIILNLLNIENKSKDDIKLLFLEQKINFNFKERFRKSIKILKEKEEICDIKITDYILQNYKIKKLFLTKNHPTSCIFKVLIEQILKILNIECSLDIFDFTNNNLCKLPGNQPNSEYEIKFFKFQYNVIIDNNYYLKIIDSII